MSVNREIILNKTKAWLDEFIIGLDICPFAKYVPAQKIKYSIEASTELLQILENIAAEWQLLQKDDTIETAFILYPNASENFLVYLDDYYASEQLLEDLNLEDTFQLVAFHPHFLFDDATPNDPANFTNRSPYPMIHILRTASVSKAVDDHPDVESISLKNMEKLRNESVEHWEKYSK